MASVVEFPLSPSVNQKLKVTLLEITYTLVCRWNDVSVCWILDIYDADGVIPILRGVPLITGADLLAQYIYLDIGGQIVALTIAVGHPPDEVPTFDNIGIDGHLFFVTP